MTRSVTIEEILAEDCVSCGAPAQHRCSNGSVHYTRVVISQHRKRMANITPEELTEEISVRVLRSGEEVTEDQLRPFRPGPFDR